MSARIQALTYAIQTRTQVKCLSNNLFYDLGTEVIPIKVKTGHVKAGHQVWWSADGGSEAKGKQLIEAIERAGTDGLDGRTQGVSCSFNLLKIN